MAVKTHGVIEKNENNSEFDINYENFVRNGFALVKNVLSSEQVEIACKLILEIYSDQEKRFGRDILKKMNELNIVRALCAFDDFFLLDIAINEVMREYVDKALGKNYVLHSQVATINEPEVELYQTAWHRELQYQHFISSRPLAVQTIFCLDPFNQKTGATFLLPASHLFEEFPSDQYCELNEFQLIANPGDVLFMNSMVYHRAGLNTSNQIRRLITNTFTSPIIGQQINLSKMMDSKYKSDPFLAGLLGFRWSPSDSPTDWRMSKL